MLLSDAGPNKLLFASAGSFIAIGAIVAFDYACFSENPILLAPFGASATLLFYSHAAEFSQPRNVILGHLISCSIGVTCSQVFSPALAAPCAVALAIAAMGSSGNVHPPAGGTALLSVLGHPLYKGYSILVPTGAGAMFLCAFAACWNNLHPSLRYPRKL